MNSCKKCNLKTCSWIALVASVIIGIIAGYVFSLGLFPHVLGVTARIALRLGVLTISFVLAGICLCGLIWTNQIRECFSGGIGCLLAGAFGTVIFSLIIMSIPLSYASTISAILVGLCSACTTLMIISLINTIRCLVCELRFRP